MNILINIIILLVILGICVGLGYYVLIKKHKLYEIIQSAQEYEQLIIQLKGENITLTSQIADCSQLLNFLTNEISNKTQTKAELEQNIQEIEHNLAILNVTIKEKEENFIQTEELLRANQAKRLREEHELQHSLLVKEEQEKLEELRRETEQRKQIILAEIEQVKLELSQLKNKHTAIIAELKRQEKENEKQTFHQLNLTEENLNDIQILKSYLEALHNKVAINKLIWSTYYQPKYKELVNRVVGTDKVSGVYKITNINNKKSYIGQSTDIAARWGAHLKTSLGLDGCSHTRFHDALNNEGIQNFTFEILEECSKNELNDREKFYIAFYETNSYGYNSTKGGS